MKAAVYNQYGTPDVVQIKEVDTPTPGENEVLVKIHATTVTAGDWRMRAGNPFAIRLYNGLFNIKRTLLGHEFSGVVEHVGKHVTRFKKGDEIFGSTGDNAGAHAEYIVVNENENLSLKPQNISHTEAAAIPVGALTALFFLRKANIQPGSKVLINGASGSVGTYAVQLAEHFGAEVTAVCSGANTALVKSLGADHTIDYTKVDFTNNHHGYDVIFVAVGKLQFNSSKSALKTHGTFLTVAMNPSLMLAALKNAFSKQYKLISTITKSTSEDLAYLTKLLDAGKIKASIDRTYPLAEIQSAHQHAESGHKKGNITINII